MSDLSASSAPVASHTAPVTPTMLSLLKTQSTPELTALSNSVASTLPISDWVLRFVDMDNFRSVMNSFSQQVASTRRRRASGRMAHTFAEELANAYYDATSDDRDTLVRIFTVNLHELVTLIVKRAYEAMSPADKALTFLAVTHYPTLIQLVGRLPSNSVICFVISSFRASDPIEREMFVKFASGDVSQTTEVISKFLGRFEDDILNYDERRVFTEFLTQNVAMVRWSAVILTSM